MSTKVFAALSVLLVGCAHQRGPDPSLAPAPETALGEPFDVPTIAREVATLRGLPLKAPIAFEYIDDATLRRRLRVNVLSEAAFGRDAFFHAFAVAKADERPSEQLPDLLASKVSGTYDAKLKKLYMRRAGAGADARTRTLVHEIVHALQDQNELLFVLSQHETNEDGALALRAVAEGDAVLTAFAYVEPKRGAPSHFMTHLLANAREQAATDERAGAGNAAPAFARRQWAFPYTDGFALMGQLRRAGGYGLVNRAFRNPPASTEQVLHVEKYLAGEMPIPVESPLAPDGYTRVASGTMGELRTVALLEACGAPVAGALGWGGDAYAVVADGERKLSVLWSTAWDDERAATAFEERLRGRSACVKSQLGAESFVGAEVTVVRERERVAYVQGLTPESRDGAARALLGLVGARPAVRPPLGEVHLKPIVDPSRWIGQGNAYDGEWSSEGLGLSASTKGYVIGPAPKRGELALSMRTGVAHVGISMAVALESPSPGLEERLARAVVTEMRRQVELAYDGVDTVKTKLGPARVHVWSTIHDAELRVAFVPFCDGRATAYVVASGGGRGVGPTVEDWLQTLRGRDDAPVCRDLIAVD